MRFIIIILSIWLVSCQPNTAQMTKNANQSMPQIYHTITLDFVGPQTSETSPVNPFTDYHLWVRFTHGDKTTTIRGFYAADGDAADSGAEAGRLWRVRFTPDRIGDWTYRAVLSTGKNIAVSNDADAGQSVALDKASGIFTVIPSDKIAPDFRAPSRGFVIADQGYLRFKDSAEPWMKGGTNSPENLLAYKDFDATYRMAQEARPGESAAIGDIHIFAPHNKDWQAGDPVWGDGRGKALIGAVNYLSNQGVNSAYFLTLNIGGDGKDVWPYRDPSDLTRFDVSKLAQWDRVFSHMQARGVLLHIVLQETENELMLDGGDTGALRSLYLSELIARFGHHPALIWNLGEENGPVSWRPEGQTDDQRMAMIDFIATHDPYGHPVILHTHAQADEKDHILTPLLGYAGLDGLSFQVADRRTVNAQTRKWKTRSVEAGQPWLITMDEIGYWHMGAPTDAQGGTHDSLRRHALWGHLMGGGAGVEWYFGARMDANDLGAEDFRSRAGLWRQTRIARAFFETHLPYTEMRPCEGGVTDRLDVYCAAKPGEVYALYLPEGGTSILRLPKDASFNLRWLDPLNGGALQVSQNETLNGGDWVELGLPPIQDGRDWVALITRASQK